MKIEFKNTSKEELVTVINEFQNKGKSSFSNFYGLTDGLEYEYAESDLTLILRVKEYDYYRLFLLSLDDDDLTSVLKGLEVEYVINIPTKKPFEDWEVILSKSGFKHYTTYSHYCNTAIATMKKNPTTLNELAKKDDLSDIHDVLFRNFSTYASHLPSDTELKKMIEEERIFVNRNKDGRVCGVNIYTLTGKTAYGNAWVDEGGRGLELMFDMLNCFIDHEVKRYVFWVRDDNKNVIKMHKMLGGVTDGLKDYTYIKNKH